jgi:hypothetical protein
LTLPWNGGEEKGSRVSGRRRREEAPEGTRKRVMDRDMAGREEGGLKAMLGLGLTGLGTRDLDSRIEVDLENVNEDEKIATTKVSLSFVER